jgi:formamidopyrimidine-DNA glycosylase
VPELPEVETIARFLRPLVVGQRVQAVIRLDPRMVKHSPLAADDIRRALTGSPISGVRRRGKFLLLAVPGGAALVLHLGMSGRLLWQPATAPWPAHTHLVLRLAGGELRLADPRRFGRVAWTASHRRFGQGWLGPDPLSPRLSAQALARRLAGRRAAIKAVLLDQAVLAGVGNIYADEALHIGRVHPATPAASLDHQAAARILRGLRRALKTAIAHGGTSFSDFVDALGHPGRHQDYLRVYGRAGQPCPRCGAPVARMTVAGRSSHFCPRCQPAPAAAGGNPRHPESGADPRAGKGEMDRHATVGATV